MVRCRYWKLTIEEVEKLAYDPKKVLLWEIKCTREPEADAMFIGVFLYRNGTPLDYTPVNGIAYYYNNINRKELPEITKFLKKKFGGKDIEKGERVFLKDSTEIYSGKEIAELAKELEFKFKAKPVITIEFLDISEKEQKEAGLPEEKLLPIPTK
ncbi:MAG TPA: hypothetical protein VD731_01115 [Nitrosopumilaceae archaeon]|nr:hypothetical protein [Nitrosopumilaceae archaeon]